MPNIPDGCLDGPIPNSTLGCIGGDWAVGSRSGVDSPTSRSVREFQSGATRDTADGKLDYEGFLSPLVLRRFAEYMHRHRFQSDGTLRSSDNWQKGIPLDSYMQSMWRHFMDLWLHHRGHPESAREYLEEALCALFFNVQGYLHEVLHQKDQMELDL